MQERIVDDADDYSKEQHTSQPEVRRFAASAKGVGRVGQRMDANKEDRRTLSQCVQSPPPELPGIQMHILRSVVVKLRVPYQHLFGVLLVLGGENEDRPTCIEQIKGLGHDGLVDQLTREARVDSIEDDRGILQQILIEHVVYHVCIPSIRLSSVEQHKRLQVFKLSESVVRGAHSLVALVAADANSDVGLRDHAYIVGSIANCQSGR